MDRPRLVLMGRAAGAFGLKGEVRVFSHAQDPEVFIRAGKILVGPNPESARPYTPLSIRPHGGRLLLRLKEINGREEAQRLAGAWVYVDRRALAPLEDGEYYWFQVKGAKVHTPEGRLLGRIQSVMDAGAHDLWVVVSPEGREAVLPVVEGVVLEMDIPGGEMIVQPPEGLLEAQGWPAEEAKAP